MSAVAMMVRRSLVDEQDDQGNFRVVGRDGLRDVLQHERLAGFWRGDDETALPLADGRDQIHDTCRDVFGAAIAALKHESLVREQRGEVFKQHEILARGRFIAVDIVHL